MPRKQAKSGRDSTSVQRRGQAVARPAARPTVDGAPAEQRHIEGERKPFPVSVAPGERDPVTGRVGKGNQLARRYPKPPAIDTPEVSEQLAARVAEIISDRGGRANLSAIQLSAIERYAVLELIVASWERYFLTSGVSSRHGRMRAAYASGYLGTLAHMMRLAQIIGLDRAARTAESPREWLERTRASTTPPPHADIDADPTPSAEEMPCP